MNGIPKTGSCILHVGVGDQEAVLAPGCITNFKARSGDRHCGAPVRLETGGPRSRDGRTSPLKGRARKLSKVLEDFEPRMSTEIFQRKSPKVFYPYKIKHFPDFG